MSRAAWHSEIERLSGELRAEGDRIEAVMARARSLIGPGVRMDEKRMANAKALGAQVAAAKRELAARARAVPPGLRQKVRQHQACLRNCEATVAALERRGDNPQRLAQMRARLAGHRARVAAAERDVDDAIGVPTPR